MKVKVIADDITRIKTDGIIVNLFEGVKKPDGATGAVDKALGGAITRMIKEGELKGKFNEVAVIHSMNMIPARIVVVAGMGKKDEFDTDKVRSMTAQACRVLSKHNCSRIASIIHGAGKGGIDIKEGVQAVTEGAVLGLYTFKKYFTKKSENGEVSELLIVENKKGVESTLLAACLKGQIIAESTNMARDMVNEPSNYMKPVDMAKMAEKVARNNNLTIKVMEKAEMEREGMGALLGVAQGSIQPPKFIILQYRGDKQSKKTIGYIGKAITFDSGGISIKPSENMKEMKGDMAGGASVIAAINAIAKLKLKINITAIVAATENMPGGKALKPGDIIKAINGKTIEVVNTDAEGRLTLADALGYAVSQGLSPVIDIATLTGACQVALGDICSGVFTNNKEFLGRVLEAGNKTGECLWEFPMKEEYRELNKSDVADVKNSGGRYGGAITAAMFLSEFVSETPWVHVDIAGTSMGDKDKGYTVKGATGVPVRTLIALAEQYSK